MWRVCNDSSTLSRSLALPGNDNQEALPPVSHKRRGRASRNAFPGRTWEREECLYVLGIAEDPHPVGIAENGAAY